MPARYEIRVAGQLDATAAAAFAGLRITASGGLTVLRGEFDQAALHGLLERIRTLGLDLVDVRRVRVTASGLGDSGTVATAPPSPGEPDGTDRRDSYGLVTDPGGGLGDRAYL